MKSIFISCIFFAVLIKAQKDLDHDTGMKIGGAFGGAAAIGFIVMALVFLVTMSRESVLSSTPHRQKWPLDPFLLVEIFIFNRLFWVMTLQVLSIVGLSLALGDTKNTTWIQIVPPLPAISGQLMGLLKGTYFNDPGDIYLLGFSKLCDPAMIVCPPECEGTGKAATALLAFALVFIVISMLVVLKRIFLGDTMVYYKLTYPMLFLASLYIAIACGIHGGWCFHNVNHDLEGFGIDPTLGPGFGAAVAAFVFTLSSALLSKRFTYLSYTGVTGGTGTSTN